MASLLAGLFLITSAPAFSQGRWSLLTRGQSRAYHACLFEAWIQDYCHWRSPDYAYAQCLAANGGWRFPLNGHWVSDEYCWAAAHGLSPR